MNFSFSDRISIPDDVLISGLQEESVILNLDSERYYGLDDISTHMFSVLTSSNSIQAAYDELLKQYDVDRDILRKDLSSLVEKLLEQGLVEVTTQQS